MKRLSTPRPARAPRFLACREGGASIEFVVVFPLLFLIFATLVEVGFMGMRAIMLDRGLDMTARNLRLGYTVGATHATIKADVCEHSVVLFNCERDLVIELVPMDLAAAYPQNQPTCRDRTSALNPVITPNFGAREETMFIRACMIVDPIFPGVGFGLALPKDTSGGYQLVTYTAFRNEP
ncbi:MAG: TadE/TadG family type IV pilus assembly protein [Pseudomonadota bacterium]